MNQEFSKAWKSSKQPGKQRKYAANAPLHIRKKLVNVHLSKELRGKVGKRNVAVKKGDQVKVMKGKFKGKEGKILEVKLKTGKVVVEGMQITKMDNSKANVRMQPSNLMIVEMAERKNQTRNTPEKKVENKEVKKPGLKVKSEENTLKGTIKK